MSIPRFPAMAITMAGIRPVTAMYVAVVVLLAGAATLPIAGLPPPDPGILIAWFLACLAGEFLVMPTPGGRGRISTATTFHLSMALSLSPAEFLPVLWASRFVAKGLVEQQPWYRVLFNSAQVVVAVSAAWTAQVALLGFHAESGGRGLLGGGNVPLLAGAAAAGAAALVYYVVNTGLVSGILAITGGGSLLDNWRRNYGWSMEILSTAALLSLAPAVVCCVAAMGFVGIFCMLGPITLVHFAGRRFLQVEADKRALIERERLSAKSEISTMVGFELTAALTSISGEVQLLARRWPGIDSEELRRRVASIRGTIERTGELTRGLTEFSRAVFHPDLVSGELVVRRAIAFLRTEGHVQGLRVETDIDPRLGDIFVDALQLQQALINIVRNSAEAVRDARITPGFVHVRMRANCARRCVEIIVEDNGPGFPAAGVGRVFEPGFTTRPGRPGFGLSTVHRIVRNHDGDVAAQTRPAGGARVRIRLPAAYRPPRHIP
jgi:signal transduction histidine kinase